MTATLKEWCVADIRNRVKTALSETRTMVLGAEILLGFQYRALFQTGFDKLTPLAKALEIIAFALLLVVAVLIISPAPYHRLSQRGDATRALCRYSEIVVAIALVLFAAALGLNVIIAVSAAYSLPVAAAAGAASVIVALALWFGIELVVRRPRSESVMKDQALPLKQKVVELLTEVRIVLPGVQALLGFQFAAYLTDAFHKLSPLSQGVHTASLLLLLLAMILLMSPAPFHRLAEHGENTARVNRVGVGFMLGGLAALALGLAGDFFVALTMVTHSGAAAAIGGLAAALLCLVVWFLWPLRSRRSAPAAALEQDAPAS